MPLGRLSEKLRVAFSRFVLEWGTSPRYQSKIPLSFKIVSAGRNKKISRAINGQTYDLSETGLSILTEFIAVDGLHAYLSNDMTADSWLEIELILPEKAINIIGQTCRYQKLQTSKFSYLLGVKIINITETDKEVFQKYLLALKHNPTTTKY